MKIKKLLFVLLAVLLVFSLFGCGKKEPVEDVDPQDTTEPDLDTDADKNTIEIDGKQYDISGNANSDVPQKKEVLLTTEELHALFKKEYEFFKWAKANLYDDQYKESYLKLPAREIGTQTDANVYDDIEREVTKSEYAGKILPDDGFEQYVAWREALEKGSSSGNNSGNTSSTGGQTQQKPSGGSSNNGGSSGGSQGSTGQNVDDTAVIRNGSGATEIPGGELIRDEYEKPSYEIIG